MASYQNYQVYRNKAFRGINVFKRGRNFNKSRNNLTKSERLMNGIALWASYYRYFPHIFVEEYFGIRLKLFQKILLYFMMHYNYFMYLAARGQGKTWLTAIFCCVRAILFPSSKIIIASGVKSQAREVIEKIDDLRKESPNLAREISDLNTSINDARVEFHNGSWIKIVASNDSARSRRANVLVVDEFRMVDLDVINKVLRKFLTSPRNPKYLDKPEYAHLQERNKELYLSSCWYKSHWSWNRFLAYFKAMLEGKKYFVCGLPYQLSIAEGLLMREQVLDEMSEDDFDSIAWSIEMECLFFGESDKAYFKFDDLASSRQIVKPIYPAPYYNYVRDSKFKFPIKQDNEIRFISCDIATMRGSQNDASAYIVFKLKPVRDGYERQIVYIETLAGEHTETQAIRIRQLFKDFDCDYIVLDTQSAGIGVYDQLCKDLYDPETGEEYPALSCMNDEKMAERCMSPNAPKLIYSVKANQAFNSEIAIMLKDAFRRGKIKLLVDQAAGKEYLKSIKGYETLPIETQVKFEAVYYNTDSLINEMINLSDEGSEGVVRLKEPSGGRKDRYSALAYGNYFANYLEKQLIKDRSEYEFGFFFN